MFLDGTPSYFASSNGQNCLDSEIVSTEEECMKASEKIRREYIGRTKSDKRPAGCYWVITSISGKDYRYSYFNTIVKSQSVDITFGREHGGICKTLKAKSHTGKFQTANDSKQRHYKLTT